MPHKYEIYRDKAGEYRLRFKYNSETMWSSEGFADKQSVLDLIDILKNSAPSAPVNDGTDGIEDLKARLRNAPIPASDRIVRMDHNSKEFRDFEDAFDRLRESLLRSNDFGDMSPDEVAVAKDEVAQFSQEQKREWVRPAHMWQVAKSTFFWLVDHAAGTVVGQLALIALTALATLLGIAF